MLNWLDKYFENTIAVILLVIMTAAIFLQVVSRTFDYSIAWTEELARYCFIWLGFRGCDFGRNQLYPIPKRCHHFTNEFHKIALRPNLNESQIDRINPNTSLGPSAFVQSCARRVFGNTSPLVPSHQLLRAPQAQQDWPTA